jgi:hypothetical protein
VDDLCSYPNNPLSTDTRTRRVGSPAALISTRAPRQHLDPGPSPTSGPHGQRPHLNYSHPERFPTGHPGPLDGLAGSRRGSLKYHRRLPPLAILPSNFPFRIFRLCRAAAHLPQGLDLEAIRAARYGGLAGGAARPARHTAVPQQGAAPRRHRADPLHEPQQVSEPAHSRNQLLTLTVKRLKRLPISLLVS